MNFAINSQTLADVGQSITNELKKMYQEFDRRGFKDVIVPSNFSTAPGIICNSNLPKIKIQLNRTDFDLSPINFTNLSEPIPFWTIAETIPDTFTLNIQPNTIMSVENILTDLEYPYDATFAWIMSTLSIFGTNMAELIVGTNVLLDKVTITPERAQIQLKIVTYISFSKTKVELTRKTQLEQIQNPLNTISLKP